MSNIESTFLKQQNIPIVLASQSPARLELLKRIKVFPTQIIPANINETEYLRELPTQLVTRLAQEKAEVVAKKISGEAIIIAADTVVVHSRKILPKALTSEDIRYCLNILSGRRHMVYTGICIIKKTLEQVLLRQKLVKTIVKFKRLSQQEIEFYCSLDEGINKAGGCGIHGYAEAFVPSIYGSYSNIMGLPLLETMHMLTSLGFKNIPLK
ncbi:nucleoside triphosphate pyrophosphatase [Candidatus Tisiphia endosymbiont of Parasteatoda lunata]|uniref:Maf family protein n=1 Tax=Candidatus Tisiphia endosymbiont of Parasteatoda lunata TaxID=3066275 RepID=UPI00313BA45C